MLIAIDLDGPCYEYDRTARYMLAAYGLIHKAIPRTTSWDTIKDNIPKEAWAWLWTRGVELGLFRYGHMVKDTRVGLEQLVSQGHRIIIVTHRPAQAAQDTTEWVNLFFKGIPLEGLYMLHNREDKTTVEWDVLIDDKYQNILDAEAAGRIGILFRREWNALERPKYKAYGWKDVPSVIRSIGAR